jgi:uncharacterized repeat protein (TIGR03899 family)
MEIKDPTGLGKALEKFIETVGQGVGGISRPYLTRKNADAKAYEIRQLAAANADAMKLLVDAQNYSREHNVSITVAGNELKEITQSEIPLLPERTETRREFLEAKKQHNIEEITSNALEELAATKGADEISDEPVDRDWISRFFSIAEDVSTEEMQKIWGKILAGEIKKPKSFSLRTLDILKNLSREEAQLFTNIAQYCIRVGAQNCFIYHEHNGEYLKDTFGIRYVDWLRLIEMGVIVGDNNLRQYFTIGQDKFLPFICGKVVVIGRHTEIGKTFHFSIKGFTTAGTELLKLVETYSDTKYIEHFAQALTRQGAKVFIGRFGQEAEDGTYPIVDINEFQAPQS